jgi:hypothetical protein
VISTFFSERNIKGRLKSTKHNRGVRECSSHIPAHEVNPAAANQLLHQMLIYLTFPQIMDSHLR